MLQLAMIEGRACSLPLVSTSIIRMWRILVWCCHVCYLHFTVVILITLPWFATILNSTTHTGNNDLNHDTDSDSYPSPWLLSFCIILSIIRWRLAYLIGTWLLPPWCTGNNDRHPSELPVWSVDWTPNTLIPSVLSVSLRREYQRSSNWIGSDTVITSAYLLSLILIGLSCHHWLDFHWSLLAVRLWLRIMACIIIGGKIVDTLIQWTFTNVVSYRRLIHITTSGLMIRTLIRHTFGNYLIMNDDFGYAMVSWTLIMIPGMIGMISVGMEQLRCEMSIRDRLIYPYLFFMLPLTCIVAALQLDGALWMVFGIQFNWYIWIIPFQPLWYLCCRRVMQIAARVTISFQPLFIPRPSRVEPPNIMQTTT
jgi:hypothetical protein